MKKLLSVIAAVAIALSALICFPAQAAENSTYIKKIVSLVYDDSGSMKGDKWAYANYAVQTFCGMLNSDDQLYITFMSGAQLQPDYTPEKIDLSSGGIQNSVDDLRKHDDDEDTPFKSVEIAKKKLSEIPCDDENAQYWLVVITDGVFDEIYYSDDDTKKRFLNEKFQAFSKEVMPNGSRLQTTFLSIGSKVVAPNQNESLGIFTYTAADADGIISAMSDLAHKVSGRTRVQSESIKKTGDNSIEISTSLPLFNIAAVSQKTEAVLEMVKNKDGKKVPIKRSVSVSYPNYSDLQGKTYLIGESNKMLKEGTYELIFNEKIDVNELVIMLEPALEARIYIEANGKVYESISDIEEMTNGEKVIVSYKIYKIGDNEEVLPSQLPEGTKYSIVLYEDGEEVLSTLDESMTLEEYVLKEKEVRIKANIEVDGFNPIGSSLTFVPKKYGSGKDFSIKGEFLNENRSVRYSSISSNEDMGICFTVYRNGEALTDVEKVKATTPEITVTPSGNEGEITYRDDGKIIFTPKKAVLPSSDLEKFEVEVSCTIGGNKTATENYTVMVYDYKMVVLSEGAQIVKTQFFENENSVSFCVKKNGVQMDKNALGEGISADFGEKYQHLKADVRISDDGVITVRPYWDKKHKVTFWNWGFNWIKYFNLEGSDLTVTAIHELGNAKATIDVKGESITYQILNVYLPLLIELILLAFLIAWIVLIIKKPRFTNTAKLYVGVIRYNRHDTTHILRDFECIKLDKYNRIKKGNGRLKFKRMADVVKPGGIKLRAEHGGRIYCEMAFPWYKGAIIPCHEEEIDTPEALAQYFERHRKLEIEEISTAETINNELEKNIGPSHGRLIKYIVIPGDGDGGGNGVMHIDGRIVINTGLIFVYRD